MYETIPCRNLLWICFHNPTIPCGNRQQTTHDLTSDDKRDLYELKKKMLGSDHKGGLWNLLRGNYQN
ncbi:HMG box domain-containing protein [Psidium guajava]|nr:HMG box domain-containing protein [Psidium guajava]